MAVKLSLALRLPNIPTHLTQSLSANRFQLKWQASEAYPTCPTPVRVYNRRKGNVSLATIKMFSVGSCKHAEIHIIIRGLETCRRRGTRLQTITSVINTMMRHVWASCLPGSGLNSCYTVKAWFRIVHISGLLTHVVCPLCTRGLMEAMITGFFTFTQ